MLKKYELLNQLQATNVVLYYKVLVENLVALMPVVYTPTVGAACMNFDRIYRNSFGLHLSFFDHRGRVRQVLDNWPFDVDIIVVTDGGRILGLGDLGTNGMGISMGKINLYVAGGGFNPKGALPIQLDCGTDRKEMLEDEFYMGHKKPRISLEDHAAFCDEFCVAVKDKWPGALIQFEDFATERAFLLLEAQRKKCLCFNDDIQGTGSVVLSGFINGMRAQKTSLADAKVVFFGAGSSAVGVSQMIATLISMETGKTFDEAKKAIYQIDTKGLVTSTRGDKLAAHKVMFARDDHEGNELKTVLDVINFVKPHALFGLSGGGPVFGEAEISAMCESTPNPLIFPLSNPTTKAEITAENAIKWSDGKCFFAAGSPFPPVEYNGKTYIPGQGNNVFIFPGVGFGAWITKSSEVPDELLIVAAQELAAFVPESDVAQGKLYPDLKDLRTISVKVATKCAQKAIEMGVGKLDVKDIQAHIEKNMYYPTH